MNAIRQSIIILVVVGAMLAASAVRVVTTTTDLADITRQVGGIEWT